MYRAFFALCLLSTAAFAQSHPTAPLQKIVCGDGVLDAGEQCDDGNQIDNDACSNACVGALCGDGILQTGEACDDGNHQEGDDCAADCQGPAKAITPPASTPTTAPAITVTPSPMLLYPAKEHPGPYYRSPKVAVWLSMVPTVASYVGLNTALIYRGVTGEKATAALALSLTGATISPSVGMLYAQQPKLAFALMGGRVLSAACFAGGLSLSASGDDSDFTSKLIFGGALFFLGLSAAEIISLPDAAKRAHPPGTPKPPTIISQ